MQTSAIAVALISLASVGQTIQQDEIDAQDQAFKRWWGTDLVWVFDDLPTKGKVPGMRVPYSGHDYPDRGGGTIRVLHKYDRAFYGGRYKAAAFEQHDTTAFTETSWRRAGLFGMRRVMVQTTPHWHGHCNGWTAAAIRHAEPQTSVRRNGVVFSPADIKGLLAEIYMYQDSEFLGGVDFAINPGTLHVVMANWLGRGSHPVGMEATLGKEKWNYPIYAYATSSAKRGDRRVEVKMNIAYTMSTRREYDDAQHRKRIKYLHYDLDLNEAGSIVGGSYFRDSSRIDMLWAPLAPVRGGEDGNERGNPHLDINEVLAMWRESVPEDVRNQWFNIDPSEEDAILGPDEQVELVDDNEETDNEETDNEESESDENVRAGSDSEESDGAEATGDEPSSGEAGDATPADSEDQF